MKAFDLRNYLDTYNAWQKIFDKDHKTINIGNMTQKDVDTLAGRLDGDMSPENLHCDGEISHAQAQRKFRELNTIKQALETYCLNNWLDTPECVY